MIVSEEDHIKHYGTPRHSGRYPYGSGGVENKKNRSFLDEVALLGKQGMTDAQIAKSLNISRNELTAKRSIAIAQQKRSKILQAQKLREKGMGYSEIGRRMGAPESTIRTYLAEGALEKVERTHTISNMLKDQVDSKGYIDVGKGVEHHVGVTRTKLDVAIATLKEQGYQVHTVHIPQVNQAGQFTRMKVLTKPGITQSDANKNRAQIQHITAYSTDGGKTINTPQPPLSISSKRVAVKYGPEGGKEADGVIFVRPGVPDISLGGNRYAQVRVAVDGTHYIKGMAIEKDDLPPGVDIMFHTNKANTGNKKDVMKELDPKDPINPFGSTFRQQFDDKGKVTSAMNLVNEEGQWDTWAPTLSSQVLSKQSPALAQKQLNITYDRHRKEFDEINSLTNPVVKQELLLKFGETVDSAAVHLKAASLPKQANKVILPISSMKPDEIHAPGFRNGDTVALIRHPHGGTFEIPQLTVNNRNREARKLLGSDTVDAVGIHHTVAQRLSGADFDGDTVLVVPNNRKDIKSTNALKGLQDFDPHMYAVPKGSPIPRITPRNKQYEMGIVSNLITDMTIKGAKTDELARAIRHSMVVIDSEKHHLDYKQSEIDHGIRSLKQTYQSKPGSKGLGASTIISRAKATHRIPHRELRPARDGGPIDPKTGKIVWVSTGKQLPINQTRINPSTGKKEYIQVGTKPKLVKVPRLSVVDDAHTLTSRPIPKVMETIYANHSNKLKDLGNASRREALRIKPPRAQPSARKVYANEVQSLNHKLRVAERNAPLERQAQLIASIHVAHAIRSHPDMEADDIKKAGRQALNNARNTTGAKKIKVKITPQEWNAIQAGAIAPSKLKSIVQNSDLDTLRALALPKSRLTVSTSDIRRAQAMLNNGYTQAEVADALGVGLTTLKVSLSGDE